MTTTYDAGREREELTQDLADWLMAGFWPSAKAQRWWRRLRRLAKATGQTPDAVYNDLRRDAEVGLKERLFAVRSLCQRLNLEPRGGILSLASCGRCANCSAQRA